MFSGETRLDEKDREILLILQDNADQPAKAIAQVVNLSPSAVERRISKLKREGVIDRIVAVVSPAAVRRNLRILVEIEIQNEYRHNLEAFQRWLVQAPEVQSCWYVTGDTDFVLSVTVRDIEEYNAFIERMMTDQRELVRKYKSLIALKTIKHGMALSVDE
ncbi:Lrp/AsnC family transcriptional regulator [Agrobacterium rhizogenes]|uniref:AsnC family transcriptional regulator n=1 Tax=Rhizobium rhizogenes NBRC 13257 TaxID=1220581 RepID=A0AA87Q7H3_RHIRH|nr:Lrp/AsnC family transcriptional regulator [Rhizobium rhizogenes]KAA6485428.1 Lrp/AsnC family transcriptional regulator [Agrobacterium sp. ICMP 7243]MQB31966.1 Lrp/AsnC family transcriptional regulator [Rhizobium rhizogenes]NTF50052.1 Lrp/AsnC family transcriptional regulator [Rhizobium rhizogenes]NTF56677.1 Lrp/AsnC family transcriptional regulator [Rhizobium rhizogenes]NTF63068.1 Lrp/AsnC family transcriptional regulator [Rhizobium rhizogenes]